MKRWVTVGIATLPLRLTLLYSISPFGNTWSSVKRLTKQMTPTVAPFKHNLQTGDHVFRWTSIVIYPIQVHGIVLSTGEGIVTIVDFGLSAPPPKTNDETLVDRDVDQVVQHCNNYSENKEKLSSMDEQQRRFSIVILSEEKELKQWKRVDYGETRIHSTEDTTIRKRSWWPWTSNKNDSIASNKNDSYVESDTDTQNTDNSFVDSCITPTSLKTDDTQCRSDPTFLVMARARFLMMKTDILPPHHVIYSNSECIAVWCKTGRWSTFQGSFFLQSTAAGQIKSAVTLAAYVGSQTVSITVPASGILGWFGMTTTSSVSLLSVQPWLLPAIAGYGLVTVATPVFILLRAKSKWEETTIRLGDAFWAWTDTDTFVQSILHWRSFPP